MGSYDGPVLVDLPDGTKVEAEASLYDLGWDDDRVANVAWLGTLVTSSAEHLADHLGQTVRLRFGPGGVAEAVIGEVYPEEPAGDGATLLGVGPSPFSSPA